MDEVGLERLDGAGTRERFEEIQAVYAIAFPGDDLGDHRTRTMRQIESGGFEAVLSSHRGRGLGRRLLEELLSGRGEERATFATNPDEPQVQQMYERWGWRKVGRAPGVQGETLPAFDLYIKALR